MAQMFKDHWEPRVFCHMLLLGAGWFVSACHLTPFLERAEFQGLLFPWGVGINETHMVGILVGPEQTLVARATF